MTVPSAAVSYLLLGPACLVVAALYGAIARPDDLAARRFVQVAASIGAGIFCGGLYLAGAPEPEWMPLLWLRCGRVGFGFLVAILALRFVSALRAGVDAASAPLRPGERVLVAGNLLFAVLGFTPLASPGGALIIHPAGWIDRLEGPLYTVGNLWILGTMLWSLGQVGLAFARIRADRGRAMLPLITALSVTPFLIAIGYSHRQGAFPFEVPASWYVALIVFAGGLFIPLRHGTWLRALAEQQRRTARSADERAQAAETQQRTSRLLEAVVEAAPLGIAVWDGAGEPVLVNGVLRRRLGAAPALDGPRVARLPDVDGADSVWAVGPPARCGDDVIRTFHERTRRVGLQRLLDDSEAAVAQARMAAGVAHEVNNPLMAVSSALQFLRDEPLTPADRARVDEAWRTVERVADALRDVLAIYNPARTGAAPTRLDGLLRRTVALVEHPVEIDFVAGVGALEVPADGAVQQAALGLILYGAARAHGLLRLRVRCDPDELTLELLLPAPHPALDDRAAMRVPTPPGAVALRLSQLAARAAGGVLERRGPHLVASVPVPG